MALNSAKPARGKRPCYPCPVAHLRATSPNLSWGEGGAARGARPQEDRNFSFIGGEVGGGIAQPVEGAGHTPLTRFASVTDLAPGGGGSLPLTPYPLIVVAS